MGKTIVVTGATRGLGRVMVGGFIGRGHTVAGCGRSAERVEELAKTYPAPHSFAPVDVGDGAAVTAWAAGVLDAVGPPDLLINNAALINQLAPLWEVPAAEFDALIDVNIKGVVNVIRAFVPAMVKRRSGVVVNFSSGWGKFAAPEVAPYCASKFAMEGLTQALAQELPDGMAAVPFSPGIINTDMLRVAWRSGAGQRPSPEEWAEQAVPFLLNLGPQDNGRSLALE